MVANVTVGLGSGYLGLQLQPLMFIHFWIAKALGIQWFDTAQQYEKGRGERVLGAMLRHQSAARIITKLGLSGTIPDESTDPSRWSSRYADSRLPILLNESLQRLRVSRIHSMLLHCPSIELDYTAHISKLVEMKERGLVEFIGFSCDSLSQVPRDISWAETIEFPIDLAEQLDFSRCRFAVVNGIFKSKSGLTKLKNFATLNPGLEIVALVGSRKPWRIVSNTFALRGLFRG